MGRGAGPRAQGPEGGSEQASPVSTRGGRSIAIRVPRGAGGGRGGAGAAEAAGEGAPAAAAAAAAAAARQRREGKGPSRLGQAERQVCLW